MSGISIPLYSIAAVAALLFGFWAVMLMDCLKRHELEFHTEMPNPKRMWTILLIVGIPWCSIIYFATVKRKD
jgi:H+/Cl- antiporter ClcA